MENNDSIESSDQAECGLEIQGTYEMVPSFQDVSVAGKTKPLNKPHEIIKDAIWMIMFCSTLFY